MVLEHAVITVRPGTGPEFEAALAGALPVLASTPGFRSAGLHRTIEVEDEYVLLVEWERLEDHTEVFRGSDRFTRWREQIGPFFADPPVVTHLARVDLDD